jgi:hypothetical protein
MKLPFGAKPTRVPVCGISWPASLNSAVQVNARR